MPEESKHSHGDGDEAVLPGFGAALSRMHGAGPVVPPALDEAILGAARAGFFRRRRFRLMARWAGAGAAAAAAVVVVAVNLHRGRPPTRVAVSNVAGDVDGNGRVDMLDAFMLARRVEAGSAAAAPRADLNGDGVVDRRDVDAVAAIAVRLPGRDAQ